MTAAVRIVVVLAVSMSVPATATCAQTQVVVGQAGILGEWDIAATITKRADGGGGRWSGPLRMKHVGFCSTDGPEEKTGELQLTISDPPGEASATLLIDGAECTFGGQFSDGYEGVMRCPGAADVPMMLMVR